MELKYIDAPTGATFNYLFKDKSYIMEQIKANKEQLLTKGKIIFDDVRVTLDSVYEKGAIYRIDIIVDEASNKYEIFTGASLVLAQDEATLVVDKLDARGKMNEDYGEWEEERPVKMVNTDKVDELVSTLGRKIDIDVLKETPATGIASLFPKEKRKAKERELASLCLEQAHALLSTTLELIPSHEKKVG